MICAEFVLDIPCGLGEEEAQSCQCIFIWLHNYLPLEKA